MITFYFPHRRVRGIIAREEDGTVARLAPLTKRDWSGKREFFTVVEKLNESLGIRPDMRLPENARDFEELKSHAS